MLMNINLLGLYYTRNIILYEKLTTYNCIEITRNTLM